MHVWCAIIFSTREFSAGNSETAYPHISKIIMMMFFIKLSDWKELDTIY